MKTVWNLFILFIMVLAFYGAWIHNWFILGGYIVFTAIRVAFETGMEMKK